MNYKDLQELVGKLAMSEEEISRRIFGIKDHKHFKEKLEGTRKLSRQDELMIMAMKDTTDAGVRRMYRKGVL